MASSASKTTKVHSQTPPGKTEIVYLDTRKETRKKVKKKSREEIIKRNAAMKHHRHELSSIIKAVSIVHKNPRSFRLVAAFIPSACGLCRYLSHNRKRRVPSTVVYREGSGEEAPAAGQSLFMTGWRVLCRSSRKSSKTPRIVSDSVCGNKWTASDDDWWRDRRN